MNFKAIDAFISLTAWSIFNAIFIYHTFTSNDWATYHVAALIFFGLTAIYFKRSHD